MRRGVLVLLSALAMVAPPQAAPAAAEPSWQSATPVKRAADRVDLAVNRRGDAAAVWVDDQGIHGTYRPRGEDWSRPQVLERGGIFGESYVVIDGEGNASAAWVGGSVGYPVFAFRPAGRRSRWQVDDPGDPGDEFDGPPRMYADADGHVTVLYTWWYQGLGSGVTALRRYKGGDWKSVRSPGITGLDMVTIRDELSVAVWQSNHAIVSATSRDGGAWSTPATILRHTTGAPQIEANRHGDILVAAAGADGVHSVFKAFGRRWQREHLSAHKVPVGDLAVTIDDRRRAAIAYVTQGAGGNGHVKSIHRRRNGSWTRPSTLSAQLRAPYGVDLATDPRGNLMALWSTDTTGENDVIQSAFRPRGRGWQDGTTLTDPRAHAPQEGLIPPHIVAEPNGMLTAAYIGAEGAVFRDFVDDTIPPVARMTYPRRAFIVGPTFRAAWSGHDDQSGIRDFDVRMRSAYYTGALSRWGRWQHRTTRTRVRFKPGEGHAYCFSVRARDRAGNVGPWSPRRCSSGAIDDRSASISRGWTRRHREAAYHHTLTNTRRAGARMVLRQVHARDLRLVARTCRRCGSVVVRYHGRRLGVFDLTSRSTRDRRVLPLARYRHVHSGRLVIRVVSHGKPVRIDGIVATR